MKKYRFSITFVISLVLHSLLLLFFLHQNAIGFKKGVGQNPKIKVSSFEFRDFDSQTDSANNLIPPQKKQSRKTKTTKTAKEAIKDTTLTKAPENSPKSTTTQNNQQEQKEEESQEEQEQLLADIQDLEGNSHRDQTSPITPFEQTLTNQFIDAQTQKNIDEFYGAEFGQMGTEEKNFIINNLAYIGFITQKYLIYPPNAGMLKQSGGNAVEFYLHPNGDISELKIIKESGFLLLDRNSIKTIEIAYKDYPHPKTKTLIRFFITYKIIMR